MGDRESFSLISVDNPLPVWYNLGITRKETKMKKKNDGLKEFIVSVVVDGRIDLTIRAKDADDAFRHVTDGIDFPMSDVEYVGARPSYCEDEDGNIIEY